MARLRDPRALRRKVRQDPSCRACGQHGSDAHHILYRSHGGDDVEDNIVTLCHPDHMILHMAGGPEAEEVRREIGKRLTRQELGYVVGKLGAIPGREFMRRHYFVAGDDPRYPRLPDLLLEAG